MSTCSVSRISTPKAISEEGVKPSRVYDTQTKVRDYDSDSTQDFEQDLVQIEELSQCNDNPDPLRRNQPTQNLDQFQ